MSVFNQKLTYINIAVKFCGIYFEFWSERLTMGDNDADFFRAVRDKYRKKFNGKTFRMTLVYPSEICEVSKTNVKYL